MTCLNILKYSLCHETRRFCPMCVFSFLSDLPSPPLPSPLPLVTERIHSPFQPKQSPSCMVTLLMLFWNKVSLAQFGDTTTTLCCGTPVVSTVTMTRLSASCGASRWSMMTGVWDLIDCQGGSDLSSITWDSVERYSLSQVFYRCLWSRWHCLVWHDRHVAHWFRSGFRLSNLPNRFTVMTISLYLL